MKISFSNKFGFILETSIILYYVLISFVQTNFILTTFVQTYLVITIFLNSFSSNIFCSNSLCCKNLCHNNIYSKICSKNFCSNFIFPANFVQVKAPCKSFKDPIISSNRHCFEQMLFEQKSRPHWKF